MQLDSQPSWETETKATPKISVTRTTMPSPKVATIPTIFHLKIHFPKIKNVVVNDETLNIVLSKDAVKINGTDAELSDFIIKKNNTISDLSAFNSLKVGEIIEITSTSKLIHKNVKNNNNFFLKAKKKYKLF